MLLSLTQSLLPFMERFAVGSLVGSFYYWLICILRQKTPGCVGIVAILLVYTIVFIGGVSLLAAYYSEDISVIPAIIIFIAIVMLICVGGAFSEGAIGLMNCSFATRVFSLFCAAFLGMMTSIPLNAISNTANDIWKAIGLVAGVIISPSAIPTFIYLWRSSQTRPGVDRHLDSSEVTALKR